MSNESSAEAQFDSLLDEALADPSLLQCDSIDGSHGRFSVSETGKKLLVASVGLLSALTEAKRKIEELREWKRQQLTVESWWAESDAFIRKHPDARLGDFVSKTALRFIQERDEWKQTAMTAGVVLAKSNKERDEARTQLAALKEYLAFLHKIESARAGIIATHPQFSYRQEDIKIGIELRSKINPEYLP